MVQIQGLITLEKEFKKEWLYRLRSNNYVKTEEDLHNKTENKYCAIGIIADLDNELAITLINKSALRVVYHETGIITYLGIPTINDRSSTLDRPLKEALGLNAYGHSTFEQIADIVEKYL